MIARSADLKTDPKVYDAKTNSLSWSDYSPGDYYWNVTAVDSDHQFGVPGVVTHFKVHMKSPSAITRGEVVQNTDDPAELDRPLKPIPLKWKGVRFSDRYEVEVVDSATKKSVVRADANGHTYSFEPPTEGSYEWTVRALDHHKNPITQFAPYSDLQVTRNLNMKTPELSSPPNGQVVAVKVPKTKGRTPAALPDSTVKLDWKPVDGAEEYQVQVAKDPDFQQVVSEAAQKDSNQEIKVPPTNAYYWRVNAKRGRFISAWSEVRQVSFTQEAVSEAPAEAPKEIHSPPLWGLNLGLNTLISNVNELVPQAGYKPRARIFRTCLW